MRISVSGSLTKNGWGRTFFFGDWNNVVIIMKRSAPEEEQECHDDDISQSNVSGHDQDSPMIVW